jgi:hypothetical protein
MLKAISISNFRGFESLNLVELRRLNIIVGPNGSGKTALLEAIFLAKGGSPELALRLRAFRGMAPAEVTVHDIDAVWDDLFRDFKHDRPARIEIRDNNGEGRSLEISHNTNGASLTLSLGADAPSIIKSPPLSFLWTDQLGHQYESSPVLTTQGLKIESDPHFTLKSAFFPSSFSTNPAEGAKILSELIKSNEKDTLLKSLREVFQTIEDIVPLANASAWMVYVKLALYPQPIPLPLYSFGAHRFVTIMLQIANLRGGALLIDELENGLYYATLPQAWRSLNALSKEYEAQLFVTTHSRECLRAATSVLRDRAEDFAVIRFDQSGGVTVVDGKAAEDAIDEGFEIR